MADLQVPSLPPKRRLPALIVGCGVFSSGMFILIRVNPPAGSFTQWMAFALMGSGLLWSVLSLAQRQGQKWNLYRLINNNVMTLLGLVALVEIGGRTAHYDFSVMGGKSAATVREAYPVCAREPDQPVPEVFFHHPGPIAWKGQPLRTLELLRKGNDNAYVDEPIISISYDREGFRNPIDLKDWQIAIIGDSYTEQGYLPIEHVTSTIVAKGTGLSVKNVGACDTGLFTHVRYLHQFGCSKCTRVVVFVMFEGNDVQDTALELAALQRFQQTGERDFRETGPQTSFVKAVGKAISDVRHRPVPRSYQNAWFNRTDAEPLPITISIELPVEPQTATPMQLQAVREAIEDMADAANQHGLTPILAYVPVNNRVYHGMIRFADSLPPEVRNWQPNSLPEFVANLCREHTIAFVDTTPALRQAAKAGAYVHNRILDCHVNAEGARIIGEVISQAVKSTAKPERVAAH